MQSRERVDTYVRYPDREQESDADIEMASRREGAEPTQFALLAQDDQANWPTRELNNGMAFTRSTLMRCCLRDTWLSRLALLPIVRCCFILQKQATKPDVGNRQFWCWGKSTRLKTGLGYPMGIKSFIAGKNFVMQGLWPLTLLPILAYDIHTYRTNPVAAQLTPFWQVLLGLGDADYFLAARLGEFVPSSWLSWVTVAALVTVPLGAGIANLLKHRASARPLSGQDYSALCDDIRELTRKSTLRHFSPGSALYQKLEKLIFHIEWDGEVSLPDGDPHSRSEAYLLLYSILANLVERDSSTEQLVAIRSLANLLHSLPEPTDVLSPVRRLLGENEDQSLFPDGLRLLVNQSNLEHNYVSDTPLRVLLANYYLFQQGLFPETYSPDRSRAGRIAKQWLFFGPFELLKQGVLLFARYHYYRLLFELFWHSAHYTRQPPTRCDGDTDILSVRPETGRLECGACSDWPFVYLQQIGTFQSCLDGLFAVPRSASALRTYVEQLQTRLGAAQNMTRLDWSQQPWQSWSDADWQQLLTQLMPSATAIRSVNLSGDPRLAQPISPAKQVALETFLRGMDLQSLVMQGVRLDQSAMRAITAGLQHHTNVTHLDFSGCQLDDGGMGELAQFCTQAKVQSLSVANNAFTQTGLDALAQLVAQGRLTHLNCAQNDCSNLDVSNLATALANTTVTELSMANCLLGDLNIVTLMPALASSSVHSIDLSGNRFSDQGNLYVINQLNSSSVRAFRFQSATMSDAALQQLGALIQDQPLELLDISTNTFQLSALAPFMQGLSRSRLQHFTCQNNFLGAQGANAMTVPSTLQSLDLQGNNIPDSALSQLLPKLAALSSINIADNGLGTQSLPALNTLIRAGRLTRLDAAGSALDESNLLTLLEALKSGRVQRLRLDGNLLGDRGLELLASQLIDAGISPPLLGFATLPRQIVQRIDRANATMPLTQLSLRNTRMGSPGAFATCHVLFRTGIDIAQLDMAQNPSVDNRTIDVRNCQIHSRVNQLGLWQQPVQPLPQRAIEGPNAMGGMNANAIGLMSAVIPVVGLLVIVFLIYRYCFKKDECALPSSEPHNTAKRT